MDYYILFGASVTPDGSASLTMKGRVRATLKAIKQSKEYLIVTSGGIVTNPPAEALLMRDLLVKGGVSRDRIITEEKSKNTYQSVINSLNLIDSNSAGKIYICTSRYHILRCYMLLRTQRNNICIGGIANKPLNLAHSKYAWLYIKEIIATLKDILRVSLVKVSRLRTKLRVFH